MSKADYWTLRGKSTVHLSSHIRDKLKVFCAQNGMTMEAACDEAVDMWLHRKTHPDQPKVLREHDFINRGVR